MRKKVACLFSFKMSSWVSCQKIVFNLHKAYNLNSDFELLNFNYSVDQTSADVFHTAHAIYAENPDLIVIMDHKPHPLTLLQILLPLFHKKKPRISFHVFGDFTLYYPLWDKLSPFLKDFEVDFIVASHRQKDLIDKMLIPPMISHVCPFPVDENEFTYEPALRSVQRQEWNLSDDDVAYVFTGRLSRQKRTKTLLVSFSDFISKSNIQNAHLFLYGNVDNIGDQFLGQWETEGEYFRLIHRTYKSLPENVQKKIHFMGSVPNAELKSVYQGADYLVNLSVHNDEDYGMSVAEAQCSGIPGILTDWGGLAGFYQNEMPEATRFIPVRIGKSSKLIHYPSIIEAFKDSYKNKNNIDREKLSELALTRFGVQAGRDIVEGIYSSPAHKFEGFSKIFQEVLQKVTFSPLAYMTTRRTINHTYRKIYSSYVRNH